MCVFYDIITTLRILAATSALLSTIHQFSLSASSFNNYEIRICLFSSRKCNVVSCIDLYTFNVGRHEYSFSFVLPKELPGSYQNEYGYIRYYIKAEVYTSTESDCEDEREIDIMSPIELPSLPQDAVRLEDKEDITPHCCVNGGSVTMLLELKNKTFVQTQTSQMKVHTYNSSDVKIESIKVKLKMV
ncbi:unnamed protein product, partial [Callosobruchus maculatus]